MTPMQSTPLDYTGAAPGADANTYILFSTVAKTATGQASTGYPPSLRADERYYFARHGIKRFKVDIKHSQAFTFNWYKSNDRGATWHQCGTEAIAVPANATTMRSFLVDVYPDWSLEIVNGGVLQGTWVVNMCMAPEQGLDT